MHAHCLNQLGNQHSACRGSGDTEQLMSLNSDAMGGFATAQDRMRSQRAVMRDALHDQDTAIDRAFQCA